MFDTLNYIIGFPILLDRFFMLDFDEIGDGEKEKLYIDIFNFSQNFEKLAQKINQFIDSMKEKLFTR